MFRNEKNFDPVYHSHRFTQKKKKEKKKCENNVIMFLPLI